MKKNPILCLLLALAMMVSLTACQIEIPGIGTVNINDGSNAGGNTGSHAGGNTGDDMGSDHTIHTGNDNDDSLALLRKNMAEVPDYIFAVAYISSAAGGPDDFELPIQEWVSEAAPELCAQYPFVRNIPRERVVGSGGSLFCVVPRDPNASVAVNRIQWNEKTGGYDNVEVLYRSESGEPILVFACADMGESIDPDTEVIVTNSGEEPLKWYPYYGIVALPYSSEDGRELGYDFTVYTENDSMDGGDVGDDGMWTAPTAEQLAAHVWTWQGDLAEQPAMATMSLTQGSGAEPGQITFTWWYTKDYGDPQEIYEGSWSLTDGGEHMDLTMTRSGGRQYTKGEAPTTVSGMFPVQVPAAFDVFPVLNVTGGGGAYGFPIQQFPYELLMFNPAQG